MDDAAVEVQITCGTDVEATLIADALVDRRLAACVQQLPIRSTYRWEGSIERDDEILLLVKTVAARVAPIRSLVDALHSYDVPAITVVEIVDGGAAYLDWLRAEASEGPGV